ncbi:MAG: BppU family phage baseplate upper protein, partial [Enterococcus avium]
MIDVKIDLNKSLNSFSNRIKVRQGDVGEKMRITLTDNKFSLENQNNLQVKFEGNIRSGDYVEGIAIPFNDKAGEFVYQFKSEDVSIPGAYQRAFIRVYDESGNRISSEDIFVEVLKDADISNNQSKIYVSKLDELLEDFDDDFGEFLTGKEEDYSALDEKSKELNSELSDLKKGSNEIKNTQTEIIQSIEDNDLATKNDLETAKQESSANVINQIVSGKKEKIVFSPNFSGKVSGSLVENANSAYIAYSTALNAPTA